MTAVSVSDFPSIDVEYGGSVTVPRRLVYHGAKFCDLDVDLPPATEIRQIIRVGEPPLVQVTFYGTLNIVDG